MTWTIGDIIALIALGCSVIGGVFALLKWKKQTKVHYSEFLKDLIRSIRIDKENRDTFYKLEYDKFTYNKKFHGSEFEKKIDKLLTQYNYFCYLRHKRTIGKDEFGFVKYQIYRVLGNKHIQNYLFNIYQYAKCVQKETDNSFSFSFSHLVQYGINEGIMNESFYDIDNKFYKHVLIKRKVV